jgi:predicted nucleic acid-binding protein
MPGSFFDTNVVLYVASEEKTKAEQAERLIRDGGTISVQVLNEVANVARRKMQLNWLEIRAFLSLIRDVVAVVPVTVDVHEAGLALAERYSLSTHDAMIAASAIDADCDVLWSEDLQHGMLVDGQLRIVNPFRPA